MSRKDVPKLMVLKDATANSHKKSPTSNLRSKKSIRSKYTP